MEWYKRMNTRPGTKTRLSTVSEIRGHELMDELDELHKELLEQVDAGEGSHDVSPEFEILKAGFASAYIDPRGYASATAKLIKTCMDTYVDERHRYVAPYTFLVMSSMMGKTRLMKEMAWHIPQVYICARSSKSSGSLKPSPHIIQWFNSGITALNEYQPELKNDDLSADNLYIFSTLKYCAFLLALFRHLSGLLQNETIVREFQIREFAQLGQYMWMWDYFAEPADRSKLQNFWEAVTTEAEEIMNPHKTIKQAIKYFKKKYASRLTKACSQLVDSFRAVGYNDKFTLLLICDEACSLCELSAADGSEIEDDKDIFRRDEDQADRKRKASNESLLNLISFSIFRALRRALRFLGMANHPEYRMPRVFGLFTDTSSRFSNFQLSPSEDRSIWLLELSVVASGHVQFDPIYSFTSIDAWSRYYNDCVTDHTVASPARLVNFGRAGWHTMYVGRIEEAKIEKEVDGNDEKGTHLSDIEIVEGKLLCYRTKEQFGVPWYLKTPLDRKHLLKLLAVLAPRLAITAGPYNVEASELIASHMAVLLKSDDDRHFLRTAYPSEPILAEASANLTAEWGWARPLQALHHYVQTGIVDSGYRGELLTKILCLMAVDDVLKSKQWDPYKEWRYSRPIPVSEFLNQLIRFQPGYMDPEQKGVSTFCDSIRQYSTIDKKSLAKFMNGRVFFTHFIAVEVTVSMEMLVQAWNRGAALMCASLNPRFDYIIPVVLKGHTNADKFGPLYGKWSKEQLKEACRRTSCIFIDSKNYGDPKNWRVHAGRVTALSEDLPLHRQNLLNSKEIKNVYVSIVQDVSERHDNEAAVIVEPVSYFDTTSSNDKNQLRIILKGVDDVTYECLRDCESMLNEDGVDEDRQATRIYLKQLRTRKVNYLDFDLKTKRGKEIHDSIVDYLPLVFCNEDEKG